MRNAHYSAVQVLMLGLINMSMVTIMYELLSENGDIRPLYPMRIFG